MYLITVFPEIFLLEEDDLIEISIAELKKSRGSRNSMESKTWSERLLPYLKLKKAVEYSYIYLQ